MRRREGWCKGKVLLLILAIYAGFEIFPLAVWAVRQVVILLAPRPSPALWPAYTIEIDHATADAHALTIPYEAGLHPKAFAEALTPQSFSEVQKARSIFRWVAENIRYDTRAYFTREYPSQSAGNVLQLRRGVCAGYANLFHEMAGHAGLTSVIVSGPAKGIDGMGGHAWNAVFVGQRWLLLDCTWASGSVNANSEFEPRFDPFYFNTPPERLIYTHFPNDPRWQLLEDPWSEARFSRAPRLNSSFFLTGLEVISIGPSNVESSAKAIITLKNPKDFKVYASVASHRSQDRGLRDPRCHSVRKIDFVEIEIPDIGTGADVVDLWASPGDSAEFRQVASFTCPLFMYP